MIGRAGRSDMRMEISHVEPVNDSIIAELIVGVKGCTKSMSPPASLPSPKLAGKVSPSAEPYYAPVEKPKRSNTSWKRSTIPSRVKPVPSSE